MNYAPQVIVALIMIVRIGIGWSLHGKERKIKVSGFDVTIYTLIYALILGWGGFWTHV